MSTPTAKLAEALRKALGAELRKQRSAARDEVKLHGVIAAALRTVGVSFTQEHRLDAKDRLDFFVDGGICIEVKKTAAGEAALRQMGRYLDHPEVTGAIGIAMRWDTLPVAFRGKPVSTIELWRLVL